MLDRSNYSFTRAGVAEIRGGAYVGLFAKFAKAFQHSDTPGVIVDNLCSDDVMFARLVQFLQDGCVHTSADQTRAHEIMGRHFCSPGQAMVQLKEGYSTEQLRSLDRISYSVEQLEECKSTHFLFPGFPGLTINQLYDRKRTNNRYKNEDGGPPDLYGKRGLWGIDDAFYTTEVLELKWYLLALTPTKIDPVRNALLYNPPLVELLYARWVARYSDPSLANGKYMTASLDEYGSRAFLDITGSRAHLGFRSSHDKERHRDIYDSFAVGVNPA